MLISDDLYSTPLTVLSAYIAVCWPSRRRAQSNVKGLGEEIVYGGGRKMGRKGIASASLARVDRQEALMKEGRGKGR